MVFAEVDGGEGVDFLVFLFLRSALASTDGSQADQMVGVDLLDQPGDIGRPGLQGAGGVAHL